MPWQNNGDGERPNPWGGGPRRGGGGGGGEPPNIDEYIRKGQERLKESLPGGSKGVGLLLIAAILIYIFGFALYFVKPNEQAVVLRFGQWVDSSPPGAHFHFPPFESVEKRGVTDENQILIGSRQAADTRSRTRIRARQDESLMLTQDENIVDVRFNVVWRIKDLGNYLFKLQDPDGTIRSVSESAMRELIGKNQITPIITTARGQIEQEAKTLIQGVLDDYEAGVDVLRVQIIESEAPEEVKDAFLDVQRAEANQVQYRNEATKYANQEIPKAQGEADQMIQQAEAYRAQTVARAQGEAARFLSVYNEYAQAKDVTRKRIYLETMEQILSGMDKVVLDSSAGSGVVPYLPLDQLNKKSSGE